MNDIAKNSTQIKLNAAMQRENLRPVEVARILGIRDNYVSMMRNEKQWEKCPASAWDATLRWINSGQTLKEFGEKHGRVLPEIPQRHELPPKVVKVQQPKENTMKPEDVGIKKIVVTPGNKEKIELAEKLSKHPFFSGESQHQKVSIDIEINLVINGKKITL